MKFKYFSKSKGSKPSTPTEKTIANPPGGYPAPGSASMFNNAQNVHITGGSFSIASNFNTVNGPSLEALYKRVASNAILNAGGRADEVRCHPGTREEVIDRIEKWRDSEDGLTPPIFWLSGPAGAGKSAIVQTIAERCDQRRVPQINFFFFRADTSRNSASPLITTLLHQAMLIYPLLRDSVASVLSANPLILDTAIENQLMQLIVVHLRDIQQSSSSYRPPLLLIDGLDECDSQNKHSQRQILEAFDKVLTENPRLFRLLVASRDESQITAAFNEMVSPLLPLYLDGQYSPERDIRVFVDDQFKRVRKTHPLAHTLNATWPSVKDVDDIVKKSSGQYIYAATVMRFILDSSASPALSLERVQGAAKITTKSPFSHLDAIYTYILSQVDDQEALKDILHAHFLILDASQSNYKRESGKNHVLELAQLLRIHDPKYTDPFIYSCLADLTPIARYLGARGILFHHASFPDYLLDKSRSRDYFVDIDVFNFSILPAVWKCVGTTSGVEIIAYSGLCRLQRLPPDFLTVLSALNPSDFSHFGAVHLIKDAFNLIYNLCSGDDDVTLYRRILREWTRYDMST